MNEEWLKEAERLADAYAKRRATVTQLLVVNSENGLAQFARVSEDVARSALMSHLARAAVPAVQPQEPVAWMCTRRLTGDKMVFSEPCVTGNPAYVKAHPHHDWQPLYAAHQTEARQDGPSDAPQPTPLACPSCGATNADDAGELCIGEDCPVPGSDDFEEALRTFHASPTPAAAPADGVPASPNDQGEKA